MARKKSVVAIGVGTRTRALGAVSFVAQLVEQAMSAAVLECTKEGISTDEKNAPIIRERMMAARQRVLDDIAERREHR